MFDILHRLQLGLYTLAILTYGLSIRLLSPFHTKAQAWVRGRKNWTNRLQRELPPAAAGASTYWFHCASLGEFEQGRPVMEKLRQLQPRARILLSFFSPSGYEIRKDYPIADHVFYLPLDTPRNAGRLLQLVRPDALLLVKYELWFHLLRLARRRGTHTYLISALFRPEHWALHRFNRLARRTLANMTRIFVQDDSSQRLLQTAGIQNVSRSGDCRVDRVLELAAHPRPLPRLQKVLNETDQVLVAGSTWPPDEDLLIRAVSSSPLKDFRIILAPHDIKEVHLQQIEDRWPRPLRRYSELPDGIGGDFDVLLNTIGDLNSAYQYGQVAYIGGGFGRGIHNTLEPAAYRIPVFFGPRYHKFTEAVDLIQAKAAFSVLDAKTFAQKLTRIIPPGEREAIARRISDYLNRQAGASERILQELQPTPKP